MKKNSIEGGGQMEARHLEETRHVFGYGLGILAKRATESPELDQASPCCSDTCITMPGRFTIPGDSTSVTEEKESFVKRVANVLKGFAFKRVVNILKVRNSRKTSKWLSELELKGHSSDLSKWTAESDSRARMDPHRAVIQGPLDMAVRYSWPNPFMSH
jgi:hypothetical protein